MTTVVHELGGRVGLRGVADRLRVAPEAYRAADRALWVITGGLFFAMALLPLYATQNHVLLAQQALYIGLLALSLNLLVATTGLITFGHAMFFGFGAYMVAVAFKQLEWSALWAFALTPVIGALSAFAIGFVVLRGRELYFSLLTLGVGQLVWAVAHGWQSLTGGTNGTTGVFAAEWLNPFGHANNLYWFIFGVCAASALVLYVITNSPFGDALRGIRENRRRAEFAGLWVKRYEMTAFVIAGTFGAVAGGLHVIGETQIASGQINWERSAIALIVALIGGVRYFLGPFAGAIFYLYVFDFVVAETSLFDTILGIIVLAVALLLPAGLAGTIHWLVAQFIAVAQRFGLRLTPVPRVAELTGADHEEVHLPALEAAEAERRSGALDGPVALELSGVTKRFGGLVAVNDVSFQVREGTMHAIIGPNGAGKTTLFNTITGLMPPDTGSIRMNGDEVTGIAPWRLVKRGLGRSFQQTNLFWALTSLKNVTLAESAARDATRRMVGNHPAKIQARAADLLGRVGLSQFAPIPAIELSHGDQRTLEIATALAVESKLLLLDEPTAGLSPVETRSAVGLIRKIAADEGLTVVFVEHDMEVVFGIADRITVMHQGSVLAEGTPDEIRHNRDVQAAYLGEEVEV